MTTNLWGVAENPFHDFFGVVIPDCFFAQSPKAGKHRLLNFAEPVFNISSSFETLVNNNNNAVYLDALIQYYNNT